MTRETAEQIHEDGEAQYLDNGGVLSHAERDKLFTRAIDALKEAEKEIESLRAFKRSVDEALNSGDGSYRP